MTDKRLRRHAFGFLEVIEKPSEAELADYYANKYYQCEAGNYRHSYPPEELEVVRLKIAQKARRIAQLRGEAGPGRLLDVGCGEGFTLAEFQRWQWQVEGIDHSKAGLLAMNPDLEPRVSQGNVFRLLEGRIEAAQRYDVVWLSHVLEHVIDPVNLLRSLRRLIAPNGVLVVTVPNDFSPLQERLLADGDIPERFWIALPDHLSYFSSESLAATAESTGWTCQDIQADFPIDLYLAHEGSNYVRDRNQGPRAHKARLTMEQLIGQAGVDKANHLYSALAEVGLGRNLTAFLTPPSE